ncbi:response regulator [candidate division KSB1 bacterium]|nr:response regulator [candidate division KSB1 bacterium]
MTPQHKILVVEDEESLATGLLFNLGEEGYDVMRAEDGRKALELYRTNRFDLIILDIMLPYIDGFQVAEQILGDEPQMPVLMLTARTSAEDRIKGLEIGADDYLTKPFHLKELLLRVRGMLKRKAWYQSASDSEPVVKFGNNRVNFADLTASSGKQNFRLTQREAMLLRYLIEHKNKVVSRQELLKHVWQLDAEIDTRTVDNFIMRLRRYFEPNPSQPVYFISIRSAGYMFRVNCSGGNRS